MVEGLHNLMSQTALYIGVQSKEMKQSCYGARGGICGCKDECPITISEDRRLRVHLKDLRHLSQQLVVSHSICVYRRPVRLD